MVHHLRGNTVIKYPLLSVDCFNRLVTVTGTKSKICKAFSAIGSKIQQVGVP